MRDNFTKAQLTELLKLKSASSYRIYWLLREHAAFGRRTIRVDELKAMLGLSEEYDRFNNFRMRVLERAREELAQTDLPFTYETIKQGREVVEIRFLFAPPGAAAALPVAPAAEWEIAVLAAGVAAGSLPVIRERLAAATYDESYVQYVLTTVKEQVRLGKVKKEGGAVFRALAEGYLLPDYQKKHAPGAVTPAGRSRANPALAGQRRRLQNELEDARNSFNFIRTSVLYTDETRPPLQQQVAAKIQELEQQLRQLSI